MGLSKEFSSSPFEIIKPEHRWVPTDKEVEVNRDKLLPPLVPRVRREVEIWRNKGYPHLSDTTRALLLYWFESIHLSADGKHFRYYFSQRESVESVIYLYEAKGCREPTDLLSFDSDNRIKSFQETWLRLVCKQATGSGKTKVLSLLLTWSYFHKKYEKNSDLSTNFLFITPNIIVLDRIRSDFDGLKIFEQDPLIPKDGYEGKNWKADFDITLHIQDEIKPKNSNGNIFLTNIHRVYLKKKTEVSFNDENRKDYFLGDEPVKNTKDGKFTLSGLIRDLDDLIVLNDEAHHIHDSSLSWFASIQDIHNNLLQKHSKLSLQLDVTATPKHTDGRIFVQTISDYPLVEAIYQGVVKKPVVPDEDSIARLEMNSSSTQLNVNNALKYPEKYAQYINLGYIEWRKTFSEYKKAGKKSVMFIMVGDTKKSDEVKDFLEFKYPDLKGEVFVIHTKKNGDISETQGGKKEKELKELRKIANEIDSNANPYKVIISVLMLKEGWDVKNVTTIVGLRAYSSDSKILPEQTLGRGLRRMNFGDDVQEKLSVIGTRKFIEFVSSIKTEGVILKKGPMGDDKKHDGPFLIEPDFDNESKDLRELDMVLPLFKGKIRRYHKNLEELDLDEIVFEEQNIIYYPDDGDTTPIIFVEIIDGEPVHITDLPTVFEVDSNTFIRYMTKSIFKDLRLFGGNDILYGKVKKFIQDYLFGKSVNLEDKNILRNLARPYVNHEIKKSFIRAINQLTLCEDGETVVLNELKVGNTKPFWVNKAEDLTPTKSLFNKIVFDSGFERDFASFLEGAFDVKAFIKCFRQIDFKMEYINSEGIPSYYFPDFVVKLTDGTYYVVETKGDVYINENIRLKYERLKTWCDDATKFTNSNWKPLFIRQKKWDSIGVPQSFNLLQQNFSKTSWD